MKIIFLLPGANMSGGVRVAAIHAQKLADRGHDVMMVSCNPNYRQSLRSQLSSIVKGQWPYQGSPSPSHLDSIDVPHKIVNRGYIKDSDIPDADVIIATWWETAEWLSRFSDRKGAKAYFIQHHEVFDYLPKERAAATYRLPLHKVTISQWLVDLMHHTYNDPDVSIVPNSVDTTQFYASARSKKARPTVGMLYSLTPWQGCDLSLEAIAKASQKIPDLQLIAFGNDDPPEGILPSSAQYYKNPKQRKIKDIYASCDVWLCGSWAEGFHLPPLEAMACRCPLVSTRVGGPIDLITEGVEGHLVPTGDASALADKLVQVLSLPEQAWEKMSNAAYQKAISYTWDDASDIFEKSLARAIDRHANQYSPAACVQ